MTENRITGASFPLMLLVLGVAVYLTVGLITMDVPDSVTAPGPKFFPTIITVVAYVVTAVVAVQSIRQLMIDRRQPLGAEADSGSTQRNSTEGSAGALAAECESAPTDSVDPADTADPADQGMNWRMIAIVVGSFLAFILLLDVLGWLLSAALLVFGVATGLGAKSMFTSAFVALTMSAIVQLAFVGGLGLPLPAGFLGGF